MRGELTTILKDNQETFFSNKNIGLVTPTDKDGFLSIKPENNKLLLTQYSGNQIKRSLIKVRKKMFFRDLNWLHYNNSERILLGTKQGLCSFSLKSENGSDSLEYLGDKNHFFKAEIIDIKSSSKFGLVLATRDDGIVIVNNNILHSLKEENGLASNNTSSLFVDNEKSIWVGTSNGISIIDSNLNILNVRTENGLITNEVNSIFANSEYIYIGTDKGLSVLDRKHLKNDTIDIPVQIKSIFLENQNQILVQNNSINLNFHTPTLEINFVGISFKSMGRIKYKYRLNTQENWQYTNNTQLTFINLASGEYNLEIQASNDNKNWSTEPARLHIQVAYPFWRTNWFITVSAFGLSFLLFGIYRFTLTRIKKREEMKRQVQNLRFEALSAQMNPHFIFNSLNSVQHFIMTNDKRESTRYLSKFAKLMRKTLDHSREKNISLYEEIEALELYLVLEALRFDNLITYEIKVDPEIDTNQVILPALLIQPIVENAILHGIRPNANGGHISISIRSEKSILHISIIDDGIGRTAALLKKGKGHNSKGGTLTKERVSLFAKEHNTDSTYEIIDLMENEKPTGTEVRIKLPLILNVKK